MSKYTAEEVETMASKLDNGNVRDWATAPMLRAYAERIKADEGAAPVGFVMEATATRHKFGLLTQDLPLGAELFTHPSAQAAQHAIDTQIVEWLERLHNLHTTVEALYVVDGYHVSVCWDDAPIYVFKGETLRDAYRAAMCVSYKDRRLVREPVTQVEETCSQCGSTHLDTGWECNDCGHDNQSRYSKTSTVTPVVFETPEALAAWLDSLHECDASGTVSNRKFEAAQIAATAIRLQLSRKD